MKSEQKTIFLKTLAERYPNRYVFTRDELAEHATLHDLGYPSFVMKADNRVGRGEYRIEMLSIVPKEVMDKPVEHTSAVKQTVFDQVVIDIPKKDSTYVSWGFFSDVKKIIASKSFYPIFISGLSGNGKTMMVEQACAVTKSKYVRVNITEETDEDDLIGGFRLINGETVWCDGPIPHAMKQGAICLIDEIDRGSNKLMCLQAVLEGNPLYIKKTGAVVHPAAGFNIIATANTKGRGSDDGRFTGAKILDEAFLERFVATIDQNYPSVSTERKIVINAMKHFGEVDEDFAEKLVTWSEIIRKTYADGGVDDVISTRRLVHVVRTNCIFNDRAKSINMCISRFDEDTRAAFLDLYTKVDATTTTKTTTPDVQETAVDDDVKQWF
jgi:MoxR-like ATPase